MKSLQAIRFLLVGATSAAAQIGVLAFLYEVCAFPISWAVSIAYMASVVVHFVGNKHFTFKNTGDIYVAEILRYLVVVLLNYLITIGVAWIVVEILLGNPYIATVASIAATVIIGFMLSKHWVFRKIGE